MTSIILIAYGVMNCVGGAIAFVKARSVPSLIAGDLSGTALIVMGVLVRFGYGWAADVGLGITLLLCVVFGMRLVKTGKMMPAGALLAVSVAVAAALAMGV